MPKKRWFEQARLLGTQEHIRLIRMKFDTKNSHIKAIGAVNGRKANEDVCRSSINYFWGLYFIAVNGRKGKRDF